MARPLKSGVDYFPKDTDFYSDYKVRILRANFGAKGMYTLDYILCELYRQNGYYLEWDKNRCFIVSDGAGCGCSPEYIAEFIRGCLQCGFFDESVFKASSVLTSPGIQRRYIRMFNSRDNIPIIREYWLLDTSDRNDVPARVLDKITFKSISCTENPDKSTENPDKITENTQSKKKVKDTIVSQKKVIVPSELSEDWNAYLEMRKKIRKPLTEYGEKLALQNLEKLAPGNMEVQRQILQQSIMNGWHGLFPLRSNGIVGKNDTEQPPASYDIAEMERRLMHDPIVYKKKNERKM